MTDGRHDELVEEANFALGGAVAHIQTVLSCLDEIAETTADAERANELAGSLRDASAALERASLDIDRFGSREA